MEKGWGFIDGGGNFVIEPSFLWVSSFADGRAAVCENFSSRECCGIIDQSGKLVLPCSFGYDVNYSEGLIPLAQNGLWGYYDIDGNRVIDHQFAWASSFCEGLAAVQPQPSSSADVVYIDRDGNQAFSNSFQLGGDFKNGLAPVVIDNRVGYIDTSGQMILEPRFYRGTPWELHFSDDLALVKSRLVHLSRFDEAYLVQMINKNGDVLASWEKIESYHAFHEGFAVLRPFDKDCVIIDSQGREVFQVRSACRFSEGLIATNDGYYDYNGNLVIEQAGEHDHFSDGLAPRSISLSDALSPRGYIDRAGEWVIGPVFACATPFSEGLAAVAVEM